jgi:L-amino acid N-acyltransferase YncA
MLDIDLGKIVTKLGEDTIGEIGASNFHGNKDEAIAAAARETGIGKDVLEAMITKLLDEARQQAMGAVKDQAATAAKGMFGKFFGR